MIDIDTCLKYYIALIKDWSSQMDKQSKINMRRGGACEP